MKPFRNSCGVEQCLKYCKALRLTREKSTQSFKKPRARAPEVIRNLRTFSALAYPIIVYLRSRQIVKRNVLYVVYISMSSNTHDLDLRKATH